MKVLCGEGVASHTDPESCAATREGRSEALTGDSAGQPLSGENQLRGADAFRPAEGNTARVAIARHGSAPRVLVDPGMRRRLLLGNRDISGPPLQSFARTAPGRPEAEADDGGDDGATRR